MKFANRHVQGGQENKGRRTILLPPTARVKYSVEDSRNSQLVNPVIEEVADVLRFFLGEVLPAGLRWCFKVDVVGGQAG
jgi:hypothetical protein